MAFSAFIPGYGNEDTLGVGNESIQLIDRIASIVSGYQPGTA
jgi:hypothetical protein